MLLTRLWKLDEAPGNSLSALFMVLCTGGRTKRFRGLGHGKNPYFLGSGRRGCGTRQLFQNHRPKL